MENKADKNASLEGRDAPPAHYSIKIKSFSLLSKASIEKFSDKFESGGYKWELSIYPTGKKNSNGHGHISIYLALVDTSSLPDGWEVNVICNFFAFDQLQNKYFSFEDGKTRRLHAMNTEWGIAKFINLETFEDPSNGYLVNDTCVFGAEVFVVESTYKGQCLSMLPAEVSAKHTWTVDGFASLTNDLCTSEAFVCGDYKWNLRLYPNGNGDGMGNSISLFLHWENSTVPSNTKLFVTFVLRIVNQIEENHFEKSYDRLFCPQELDWGYPEFMSLVRLKDSRNGFLMNDTCILEAEVTVRGLVKSIL